MAAYRRARLAVNAAARTTPASQDRVGHDRASYAPAVCLPRPFENNKQETNHETLRHTLDWNGILIEVRYCRNWSPGYEEVYGYAMSHIEIESIEPARAVLPLTSTGYKSHFVPKPDVVETGSVLDYVTEALEQAAANPAWKAQELAARQYSLL